jgi:endonuclease IV
LTDELRLTSALGGDAFVIHGGAYSPEGTSTQGIALFAETLARAVGESACAARILLENVPGGGRRMGGSLEELARLCEATAARGVTKWGLCLDTAHAWAAGDDVSSPEGIAAFVARARALCGANAICAYHLNDSGVARGSRLENHAPWGAGSLGTAGLAALMKSRSETDVVGILESPAGFDGADFAMAVRLATV